jgi:tight adherence protein B
MISVLAFLGVFLATIAANAILLEFARGEMRRIDQEVQAQLRQRVQTKVRALDLGKLEAGNGSPRPSLAVALDRLIEQSGLAVTPRKLAALALAAALVAGAAVWLLTESALLALPIATAASVAPLLFVFRARHQRREKLLSQLSDTFELMSRVLRSGQTISQAMQVVADQGSPPVSLEFYRCHEQMNLGMSPDAALHDLAQRTGLLEMKIFTVAVLVQRQAGGNLSELFDKMGTVVRERFRIRGMIQSLTAQGRMQALLLTGLPVAMFGLMMFIQPTYERQLFNFPLLIMTAIGLVGLGGFWIRKVVTFDF